MIPRKAHHKKLQRKPWAKKTPNPWQPKPDRPVKVRKRINPRGKSNRSVQRRAWQAEMMGKYAHVDYCEWPGGCSDTFGLANAHRLKKTKITSRSEYVDGRAMLCGAHHRSLDEAVGEDVHQRMYDTITAIIESR